ncbi:hypothetical protein G7Z17_g2068 [Cylindrodendrum hubeiense]|uniref:Carrier domain-containing protein n=1 Tax=Cylindrodendrum hubeiense TaxID=595255 RepID=A0A9P5LLD7_9HYPO|nr:hypothetical protein G7Z17_g2068 [Cylindrodendrum hubeiense]
MTINQSGKGDGPALPAPISPVQQKLGDYWGKALAGCECAPFPVLPTSIDQPRVDSVIEHQIPPLRGSHGITTSTLIHAAWALVAARMTNSDNVVFGTTLTRRGNTMDPTVAPVPIWIKLDQNQTILNFLTMVQQQEMEMIQFQHTEFQQIASTPEGRQACMFQTLVVVQPQDFHEQHWRESYSLVLEIHEMDQPTVMARFDSRVVGTWMVENLMERLELVVSQLQNAGHTTKRIADTNITTQRDLEQIWEWNQTVLAPVERCLHEAIDEFAEAYPAALAVCAWDGELTYGELNRLATRLASHLIDLGVGSEVLVPLCFEKSMWTTVAVLAVLKAGGGFVLLDPYLPEQRLQAIVRQVKANMVLSSPLNHNLSSRLVHDVITINLEFLAGLESTDSVSLRKVCNSSPAYVMFTSGSTGAPKGAVITHKNVASAFLRDTSQFGYAADSRIYDFASYSFAISVTNIFAALSTGGCLCVPSDHDKKNDLARSITSLQANIAILTPSVAATLSPDKVPGLKTIILVGEAVRVKDIAQWQNQRVKIFNGYGTSECSTCNTLNSTASHPNELAHIGKGAGTVTWIVDPENHHTLLPPGCAGELLLEGPLLGRGYLHDPEKTAAVFLDDPPAWLKQGSSSRPGRHGRIYKTGDIVCYNEEGNLIYLGRKDDQVKIRGQRVELQEIEHWVQDCVPEATQVVVETFSPRGSDGSPILGAFLLIKDRSTQVDEADPKILPISSNIEDELAKSLPTYMIPSVFFSVSELPMTATGKMSRKQLRQIGASFSVQQLAEIRTAGRGPKQQPRSQTEREMQRIWADILGIEVITIGLDDSFLKLGGDSIDAMKVVGEARKFGLELAVSDIFQHPTLHQVSNRARSITSDDVIQISRPQQSGPTEQSFAQARLYFLEQLYPGLTWYHQSYATRILGPLQLDALSTAIHTLEARHEILRTTFPSELGVGMQAVQTFQQTELNVVDIPLDDENFLQTLRREQTTPFNLQCEPGWRVSLYRSDKEIHVLSIVMHHIISDGWSIDILRRELAVFYSAATRGHDPLSQVEHLHIQYRDYSIWQKKQHYEHQRQLEYWVRQLSTSRPAEIRSDKPRPPNLSGKGDVQSFRIDGSLYSQLRKFCAHHEVTPFVVLLTAFKIAHYRLTGIPDATVGTANANRSRWELRNIIGFFVNLQCIRMNIEDESFEELVHQVQATSIASFANQDVPFEKIVSKLTKGGDLSRNPLVQVVFALHSQLQLGQFTFEGTKTEQIPSPVVSRFDMEFHFYQEQNSLRGEVLFSTDLYGFATIQNLLSVFLTILERGLEAPKTKVVSLPLLTGENYSILEKMNVMQITRTAYPRDLSIIDVFYQQVNAYPHKVAVKDSSSHLTYTQVDELSDKIAQWLVGRSYAPESLIGVFASRSCETILAFLGILKANLAYLPLDVKTPVGRVRNILSSIQGDKIVLLGPDTHPPSLQLEHVEFIGIAEILNAQPQCLGQLPTTSKPSATSLAYIMFTSGSTGQPKGVMIEHRGVVRLVKHSNAVQTSPTTPTMAHISNIAFDAATWEIYAALLNGGTLVCIDNMVVLNHHALTEVFTREKIGCLFITPALLKQYLLECSSAMSTLEALFVGGERSEPQDLLKARGLINGKVHHVYGPTENTSLSTIYCLSDLEEDLFHNGVPIGRAISNSGAYVMDTRLTAVPLGIVGELVLTGDGLARGYIDPQQNLDRFVTVMIDGELVRAYRTGDYARYRPSDHQLEFLGRVDGQIKIRGQRVELGEIEHVLQNHDAVDHAIIIVQHTDGQEDRLLGFVTILDSTSEQVGCNEDPDDGNEADHLEMWEETFDTDTYTSFNNIQPNTIGRDFTGWTSMFDGRDIDKEEMNEWLDDTIETLLNGSQPGNILEIGTGSGMILFSLKELATYVGLEPSGRAVAFVTKAVNSFPELADKVTLHKGTAANVNQLDYTMNRPNLAVINSVAQYFPSQDYLFTIVKDLLQLKGMKQIFLGDIRSHALYREFQAAKCMRLMGDKVSKEEVRRKMKEIAQSELELLVDPAFFTSLPSRLPHLVEHVEILPKMMKSTNELSCFRYAAVIHVKDQDTGSQQRPQQIRTVDDYTWIDFVDESLDRQSLLQLLRKSSNESVVAVGNIPYEKTIFERHVIDSLDSMADETLDSIHWLSVAQEKTKAKSSMSASELAEVAEQAGYRVELSCARQYRQRGGLDAIFHHYKPEKEGSRVLFRFPTDYQGRSQDTLSSHPMQQHVRLKVQEELYQKLHEQLPAYMVPQMITILDNMPVNQNGKVDRQALVARAQTHTAQKSIRQPISSTERQMQKIWAQVLSIEPKIIGLDDSFFQLGGNSIAAMRVVSGARKIGLEVTVADIFSHPQLHEIARLADSVVNTEAPDAIEPFALLDNSCDVPSILQNISIQCRVDSAVVQDAYPCTPLQEGLLSLTSKRSGEYVMRATLEISPNIKIEAFRHAWEKVYRTTAVLRTRVVQHDDIGLLQVVIREEIDWIESCGLDNYLKTDETRPTELGQPLARFALIQDEDGIVRWFVLTMHHAIYDGWSASLILDAVERAYLGDLIQEGPQFQAFIKYIGKQDEKSTATYWRSALADCGAVPFPALPPSIEQPMADTVIECQLPRLREQSLDITASTIIRAAWGLVAGGVTNTDDVVFGVTLFGRNAPITDIDKMAAPLFATCPMRIKLASDQKVSEYLMSLQRQATEMIPFEQTGLHRIARISSHCQLACQFQTLLVIQAQQADIFAQNAFGNWRHGNQQQHMSTYALEIEVTLGVDGITVRAIFDSRVIQACVVQGLLKRLEFVLQQLESADPEKTLAGIEIISLDGLEQIWEWNHIAPARVDQCVHEMVQERAQSQPASPAVCAWDGELTYRELDELSTHLAGRLFELGVGPETLVPLCFEKSMWTPVAMLAVLKAGGAFVMLDPSLPEQRMQAILKQLKSDLILSSAENAALSSRLSRTVIQVDADSINFFKQACQPPTRQSQSSHTPMFVVFTSGSTGTPKGVILTHSNVASGLKYQADLLGLREDSRVFDFASYAFDTSVQDAFATFFTGACLCIPAEKDRRGNIGEAISAMRATVADLTPSVARLVDPISVPDLKTLILGGESVSINDITRWWGKTSIVNAYGPSECTITSTINSNAPTPQQATCIGKGAGLVTWVVDPENHHKLLPPGSTGELLLEGPLVGRGYLNDSDKTAAAFVEDPIWLLKGTPNFPGRHGRLYKTGDLVQYNEDGSLVFIGRKDSQVKIRGQRVELEEVEHHVQTCMPEARQLAAEVIVSDGENASPILAVFLHVDSNGVEVDGAELTATSHPVPTDMKEQLSQHLPPYMMPTVLFELRQMPLTPSGKTDRKQLRKIGRSLFTEAGQLPDEFSQSSYATVDDKAILETEQPAYTLAKKVFSMLPSWSSVKLDKTCHLMGFTNVLLHSCGLDSVNLMSLMYFITHHLHVQVSMQTLVDKKTSIRELARFVSDSQKSASSDNVVERQATEDLEVIDVAAEVSRYDSEIVAVEANAMPQAQANNMGSIFHKPLTVLLTGANGFIGTQILRELLEHRRVKQVIAIGDLSLPHLGLDAAHWSALADGKLVDVIIHNGAAVHWSKTYESLKAVNITSTCDLLELVVTQPHTRFVYITGGRQGISSDEREEDVSKELSTTGVLGYIQTKFVAESVVRRAAKRNISQPGRLHIVSPGLVVGTSTEGVSNADDYLWRLAAACIKVGAYNVDIAEEWLPVSDAGTVAMTTIDAALGLGTLPGLVSTVTDGMTWGEFYRILVRIGYTLEAMNGTKWLATVRRHLESERETHPLWPVAHLLKDMNKRAETKLNIGKQRSDDTPLRLKVAIMRSAEFLSRVGFLPLPATGKQARPHNEVAFIRSGI